MAIAELTKQFSSVQRQVRIRDMFVTINRGVSAVLGEAGGVSEHAVHQSVMQVERIMRAVDPQIRNSVMGELVRLQRSISEVVQSTRRIQDGQAVKLLRIAEMSKFLL